MRLAPAAAAVNGLRAALIEGNYRSSATAKKFGDLFYFYLPADLYDQMVVEAVSASKRIYTQAGGDPTTLSDEEWLSHVRLAVNAAHYLRQAEVTITPLTLEDLIEEVFGNILPRFGLAQRYPAPYYIADTSRREVEIDLHSEGLRVAALAKYDQPVNRLVLSFQRVDVELRERNILPESEYAEVTRVVDPEAALREWANTAPVFTTYEQCRAAAEQDQVGSVPDRWRHCLSESDMVDQAVSHALIQRGIRPYPGSLELPEAAFDSVAEVGLAITQEMVYQRTYTPTVGGKVLQLAQ